MRALGFEGVKVAVAVRWWIRTSECEIKTRVRKKCIWYTQSLYYRVNIGVFSFFLFWLNKKTLLHVFYTIIYTIICITRLFLHLRLLLHIIIIIIAYNIVYNVCIDTSLWLCGGNIVFEQEFLIYLYVPIYYKLYMLVFLCIHYASDVFQKASRCLSPNPPPYFDPPYIFIYFHKCLWI